MSLLLLLEPLSAVRCWETWSHSLGGRGKPEHVTRAMLRWENQETWGRSTALQRNFREPRFPNVGAHNCRVIDLLY